MITRIIVIITIHYFDTTFLYLSTFIIVANKRNFSLNRYIVLCDTSGQRNYIVQIYRFENSASSSSFEAENLNRKSNQKPLDTVLNHPFHEAEIKSVPMSCYWYEIQALSFSLRKLQTIHFRVLLKYQNNRGMSLRIDRFYGWYYSLALFQKESQSDTITEEDRTSSSFNFFYY